MTCEEARDLITALIDHELSVEEGANIQKHLESCSTCQTDYREEERLKTQLRIASSYLKAPAELRQRILGEAGILAAPDRIRPFWQDLLLASRTLLRPAFLVAMVVLLIVPALYLTLWTRSAISLAAVGTYEKVLNGQMQLVAEANPEKLKQHLVQAAQGRFAPMGYDLSIMNLQLKGGLVGNHAGRKFIAVLYQGNELSLICYTFLGTEADAPGSASVLFDNEKKMHFYAFAQGNVNAVMHREGDTMCILASAMPMHELLALARSKARPA